MSINITTLESSLQSKLNATTSSTESKDFLLLTKSLESINSGAVSEIANTGALPTASANTGRVYFVTADTKLYFSNGSAWVAISSAADITSAVNALVDSAPGALDTLNELAAALGDDANFSTTVTNSLATKAPLANPTFTGTATAPTVNASTALQIGGTAITATAAELNTLDGVPATLTATELGYVDGVTSAIQTQINTKANISAPTFTGTVTIGGATYPTSDGSAGQVLTTNGSGAVSFSDPGGGGSLDFVASGTIANGAVVVLNANGTISTPTTVTEGIGTTAAFSSSGSSYAEHMDAVFDSTNNKVIVVFKDQNNNNYPTATVGTVSGNAITFGTPAVIYSGAGSYLACAYDSNDQRVMVAYRDAPNSGGGHAKLGTVSGTSISFPGGSGYLFESGNTNHIQMEFDPDNNKVLIVYSDSGDSNKGKAVVATIAADNTTINFGSILTFHNGETYGTNSLTYDTNANKFVIAYNDNANSRIAAVVATISGTSVSVGSAVEIDSTQGDGMSICFDSTNNKVIVAYKAGTGDAGGPGRARVGTVSGTSISWGTTATFFSTAIGIWGNSAVYDASQQKVVILFSDRASPKKGRGVVGTVSGTDITFTSATQVESTEVFWPFAVHDSNSNKTIFGWATGSASSKAAIYSLPSTDAGNYIGVASAAISNSATGSITIDGGINESQSSLTIGTSYYVADSGSLQTTNNGRKIGKAISATKLLVNSNMSGDEMNEYLGGLV
jgi:hypothetical protein